MLGQVPLTVIGVLEKTAWFAGSVMVAAVVGGFSGIVPDRLIEDEAGGGLALAIEETVKPASSTPATRVINASAPYEVCSCGRSRPLWPRLLSLALAGMSGLPFLFLFYSELFFGTFGFVNDVHIIPLEQPANQEEAADKYHDPNEDKINRYNPESNAVG